MELRQLRYLVALADEQHFTRAAAREHIAQPALSQQIRRLEQEVGLALVERTTRKVTVTEAGKTLVARARRILSEVDAANAELQALAGVRTGHVSVGTMHTMGPVDVSHALAVFHERHPGVELTVREQSSEELAEMLRDDVLDLAFLSVTERIETQGLVLRQLVSEELVAVLPSDHRAGDATPAADGGARRRAVRQLPRGRPAARAADVRRPTRPGSSRRSSSSPTRASGSGGWWRAAWASRSSPNPTPTARRDTSRWRR